MKARRQIVDPITGGKVDPNSPVAIDTGQRIVGRGTVVDDEELDPSRDRFGIDPAAEPALRARIKRDEAKREEKTKVGRGPPFPTTMESPDAGVKQFLGMNPELDYAFGEGDVGPDTREFMDRIEVKSGKGHVRLNKSPIGKRIVGDGRNTASNNIGVKMLKFLFGQAKSRRWRDVPWGTVLEYAATLAPDAPIAVPVAAGIEPPDVVLARVREEYGPAAAAKLERKMNQDELEWLAERLDKAIKAKGEECLSAEAETAARARLATIRKWARRPQDVPEWSCVGTMESEGHVCTFPAILEDIQRLESSCDRDYDPRWPVHLADRACEEGESNDAVGLASEPCAIARQSRHDAEPRPKLKLIMGRLVRV